MPDPSKSPDLSTEAGRLSFNRILNQRLPVKRNIAQGLLRNEVGDVLLCELTYKRDWDLPGGVVDPRESPAACVEREVSEELDLDVVAGELLAVNWLPPYRGWDDAVLFLHDLGTMPAATADRLNLLKREIKGVHWVAPADVGDHVAAYTATMLAHVLAHPGHTAYLENSTPRERN